MSRPKLLPPLAPETVAFLEAATVSDNWIAPRHAVNAEAHPLLVQLIEMQRRSERHFREMDAANRKGEIETFGTLKGKPTAQAAQWAKRKLDNFNQLCRIAFDASDEAFHLHLAAIESGMDAPGEELANRAAIRKRVYLAHKFCAIRGRKPLSGKQYVPTAGEIAEWISENPKALEFSTRDIVNHLKALGLPYATGRRGKRKSI